MQKWEYKIVELRRGMPGSENLLNELGSQGWEMCGFYRLTTILKRTQIGGPIHTRRVMSGDADEPR